MRAIAHSCHQDERKKGERADKPVAANGRSRKDHSSRAGRCTVRGASPYERSRNRTRFVVHQDLAPDRVRCWLAGGGGVFPEALTRSLETDGG